LFRQLLYSPCGLLLHKSGVFGCIAGKK
jgi:hypothetical protein